MGLSLWGGSQSTPLAKLETNKGVLQVVEEGISDLERAIDVEIDPKHNLFQMVPGLYEVMERGYQEIQLTQKVGLPGQVELKKDNLRFDIARLVANALNLPAEEAYISPDSGATFPVEPTKMSRTFYRDPNKLWDGLYEAKVPVLMKLNEVKIHKRDVRLRKATSLDFEIYASLSADQTSPMGIDLPEDALRAVHVVKTMFGDKTQEQILVKCARVRSGVHSNSEGFAYRAYNRFNLFVHEILCQLTGGALATDEEIRRYYRNSSGPGAYTTPYIPFIDSEYNPYNRDVIAFLSGTKPKQRYDIGEFGNGWGIRFKEITLPSGLVEAVKFPAFLTYANAVPITDPILITKIGNRYLEMHRWKGK